MPQKRQRKNTMRIECPTMTVTSENAAIKSLAAAGLLSRESVLREVLARDVVTQVESALYGATISRERGVGVSLYPGYKVEQFAAEGECTEFQLTSPDYPDGVILGEEDTAALLERGVNWSTVRIDIGDSQCFAATFAVLPLSYRPSEADISEVLPAVPELAWQPAFGGFECVQQVFAECHAKRLAAV